MSEQQPDEAPEVEHGTYAGYQWHRRVDVPLCDPCREANRQYQAAYRAGQIVGTAGDAYRERNRKANQARSAAAEALKRNHPAEYQQLLVGEKRKRGVL